MKWQYTKISLNETARREDELDLLLDAGEEGWELVTITPNNIAYLKRPVRSGPAPATNAPGEDPSKYRDPATGDTWSGRGRMPNWLKRKVDAGEDIEKYRSDLTER